MSNESLEVRVARLEENLKFLVDDAKEAKAGRKTQYDAIETLRATVQTLASDMSTVKDTMAGQKPTIEEFITIKHKVAGAGKLGSFIWAIGGAILGIVGTGVAAGKWLIGS